jgi:uncharacterized protein YqeY
VALKDQVNTDLKAALLGGDRFKGEVLRGLKAVILDEEVKQNKRDEGLDDSVIEQLVAREVKKRAESATIYDGAERKELADNERAEAAIIATYLPQQLSKEEIQAVVTKTITDLGVTSMAGMGQVIGAVKKELGNAADGSLVAQLVKDALQ